MFFEINIFSIHFEFLLKVTFLGKQFLGEKTEPQYPNIPFDVLLGVLSSKMIFLFTKQTASPKLFTI